MHFKRTFLVCTILVLLSAVLMAGDKGRHYVSPRSGDAALPFSDAVRTGDTLYVSGHLGLKPGTRETPEDPKEEARLMLEGFQGTLKKAGYEMDDLVSVTLYCSDVSLFADFNTVYRKYFKQEFPARAFVGSGPLLFNARFELQGIAVKR
jgi:reactive intermediate/imine deaminase